MAWRRSTGRLVRAEPREASTSTLRTTIRSLLFATNVTLVYTDCFFLLCPWVRSSTDHRPLDKLRVLSLLNIN